MSTRQSPFGGGRPKPIGDVGADQWGTVRKSPNGTMIAILWPSDPHPARWMVSDGQSLGYEKPDRICHWPVIGAVPGSAAAGMSLAKGLR